MKSLAFVSVSLASLVVGASGASAGIVGSSAVLVPQSMAAPGAPAGFQTFDVFVQFTSTTDTLISHTGWNVTSSGGTFFNASPTLNDPFGIIPDNEGNTPRGEVVIPGYEVWNFDTNLSINDNTSSIIEPGSSLTSTSITGGITGPSASAGGDFLIQIAQITISNGGTFSGTATINHNGGSSLMNITNVVPAPGAIALLGVAGLVGSRRRRTT